MFLSASTGPAAGPSCEGREGPEDALIVNGVRNRRKAGELARCPVCGCTLRAGELQTHLGLEMDKLAKISGSAKRRGAGTPNSSSSGLSEDVDISGSTGSEVYERVRRNRSRRLRLARGRAPVQCPVCGERLSSAGADLHVDACLRGAQQEDESVDVETDGPGFGTVYSWCSQERVRAAALQLQEGGALPEGAHRVRRASTDTDLVVDGDEDTLLYGPPQYSPERIAPQEQIDDEPIVSVSTNAAVAPLNEVVDDDFAMAVQESNHAHTSMGGHDMIVDALKGRIRELELRLASRDSRAETKCLICMGAYTEPVVSVQCWHVHCETCWLDSLRAKKTCPQCNAITTASHLRRIYI